MLAQPRGRGDLRPPVPRNPVERPRSTGSRRPRRPGAHRERAAGRRPVLPGRVRRGSSGRDRHPHGVVRLRRHSVAQSRRRVARGLVQHPRHLGGRRVSRGAHPALHGANSLRRCTSRRRGVRPATSPRTPRRASTGRAGDAAVARQDHRRPGCPHGTRRGRAPSRQTRRRRTLGLHDRRIDDAGRARRLRDGAPAQAGQRSTHPSDGSLVDLDGEVRAGRRGRRPPSCRRCAPHSRCEFPARSSAAFPLVVCSAPVRASRRDLRRNVAVFRAADRRPHVRSAGRIVGLSHRRRSARA